MLFFSEHVIAAGRGGEETQNPPPDGLTEAVLYYCAVGSVESWAGQGSRDGWHWIHIPGELS